MQENEPALVAGVHKPLFAETIKNRSVAILQSIHSPTQS